MERIFSVTVARCVACGKCELACAFTHGRDGLPGASRISVIRSGPDRGTPVTCLQCHDAACVAACPADALVREPATGAIRTREARCLRCGMCVAACPFGNMRWEAAGGRAIKCDLCGGEPRCVPFCPTRALEYLPA
ncbi:MAG: 4Fe-4S dicluster domain-containing protein [Candidatus Methylomirabilales bacterium]